MLISKRWVAARAIAAGCFFGCVSVSIPAQQPSEASVIQMVDAAVKARIDGTAAYNVTEHYAVYRGSDETQPAAEMTVKTVYKQETGKSYTILSQSGSEFIGKHVLGAVLDREKEINLPAIGNTPGLPQPIM
jgi:hypothetical protein